MITTYIPNYLFSTMLNGTNNAELLKACYDWEKYLVEELTQDEQEENYKIPYTTSLFNKYNFFTYPNPYISQLYTSIRDTIGSCLPEEPHMISCWLNVYHNGENIKAHRHWSPKARGIHGFYCVNTETVPSHTTYKVSGYDKVEIESKDGLLVFGKSDDDVHYTSIWTHDIPRVTIAFDILPISTLPKHSGLKQVLGRFIPFKS